MKSNLGYAFGVLMYIVACILGGGIIGLIFNSIFGAAA